MKKATFPKNQSSMPMTTLRWRTLKIRMRTLS